MDLRGLARLSPNELSNNGYGIGTTTNALLGSDLRAPAVPNRKSMRTHRNSSGPSRNSPRRCLKLIRTRFEVERGRAGVETHCAPAPRSFRLREGGRSLRKGLARVPLFLPTNQPAKKTTPTKPTNQLTNQLNQPTNQTH